jgi:hypothetical protein
MTRTVRLVRRGDDQLMPLSVGLHLSADHVRIRRQRTRSVDRAGFQRRQAVVRYTGHLRAGAVSRCPTNARGTQTEMNVFVCGLTRYAGALWSSRESRPALIRWEGLRACGGLGFRSQRLSAWSRKARRQRRSRTLSGPRNRRRPRNAALRSLGRSRTWSAGGGSLNRRAFGRTTPRLHRRA